MTDTPHKGLLHDESGSLSSARVLLFLWSINSLLYIWLRAEPTPVVMAFFGSIETALICWAAGPRIAQYIAPQIGSMVSSISKAEWRKTRDPKTGEEPTAN